MFFGFYLIFSASMLYAARFNDNDAAHKLHLAGRKGRIHDFRL